MSEKERLEIIIGTAKVQEISEFSKKMMKSKGVTDYAHNQITIFPVSKQMCDNVLSATGGYTVLEGKRFAIEASKLYHEIQSHSNAKKEEARGQIPITENDIYDIVETMLCPDIIEDISHGDSLDERNVFAVVKKSRKYVVVVLSVGGKRNPNVTPQQIIFFTYDKWNSYIKNGMVVREILYGNNKKRKADTTFIENIKKNRVTVAHHES